MATEVQKLGQRIAQLENDLARFKRAGVGLGRSSFEDGSINSYYQGQLSSLFGLQWDGSNGAYAVSGPTPPTPKWGPDSLVEGIVGGIRVRWDGVWEGGSTVVAPMGFRHVEVHVDTTPDFSGLLFSTLKTTIHSARGGEVLIPLPATDADGVPIDYYVRLVARSDAGQPSPASAYQGPVNALKIRQEDLDQGTIDALAGTTVYYGPDAPSGQKYGDLWLMEVTSGTVPGYKSFRWTPGSPDAWKQVADQGATDALAAAVTAQTAADAKAKVFTQGTPPAYTGGASTAIWIDSAHGHAIYVWDGAGWVPHLLGNGAIQPASLVASDVVVTGTVTAALLEAILILATTIVAGDINGTHVKIKEDGVYVYAADLADGIPNEVVRMGTSSNDFFGITDANGLLILSLDDTGQANLQGLNVTSDPVFMGVPLSKWLGGASGAGNGLPAEGLEGAQHYYGFVSQSGSGITAEVGLIEQEVYVDANRQYLLIPEVEYSVNTVGAEVHIRVRDTQGAGAPSLSSPQTYYRQFHPAFAGYGVSAGYPGLYRPAVTGMTRLFVTIECVNGSANVHSIYTAPVLTLIDLGPAKGINASQNNVSSGGAGTAPPPKQQYYVEIGTDNRETFRGDGSARFDTSDIVQGWDPSGFNGDGYGWFGFGNQPTITGTVDRVDLYLYFNHWYFNSGGSAIINIIQAGTPNVLSKLRGDWIVPGWPKPGGVWVTLPSDWWPFFAATSAQRAYGISLGPSGGTNEVYYGRASDCRLRLWYTQ